MLFSGKILIMIHSLLCNFFATLNDLEVFVLNICFVFINVGLLECVYELYSYWFQFNKIKNTKLNNQFEKRDVNMKFYSKSQFQSQREKMILN